MSNAMTEFRITSDLSALRSQIIDANFDEVREWLEENLAPYRTLEVTQDAIPQAKVYRANIRKVKDRIEQSRKEAKNAALAAYAEFESKCKALTGLCDESADAIDRQVKDYEEQEKEIKLSILKNVYDTESTEELRGYLTWDRMLNPKWVNKGYPAETAKMEIVTALRETEKDLETIRGMGGDDTPYLLDVYRREHDLSAVVRKASELKTMREREEARKREAEERRKAAEAEYQRMREQEQRKQQEAQRQAEVNMEEPEQGEVAFDEEETAHEEDPLCAVAFKVVCTKSQLLALGQYMREHGIKYGRAT